MIINPADIKVDIFYIPGSTWLSKGTGVSVTHMPTGITTQSSSERSQHANKARAFEELMKIFNLNNKQMELFNEDPTII